MAKVYTAQEMREESNKVTRYDCYVASDMLRQAAEESESVGKLKSMLHEIAMIASECNECDSYNYTEFCAEAINRISSVINASADAMEREERKKRRRFQYGTRTSFVGDHIIREFDSRAEAEQDIIDSHDGTLVRREVGEWEEVKE